MSWGLNFLLQLGLDTAARRGWIFVVEHVPEYPGTIPGWRISSHPVDTSGFPGPSPFVFAPIQSAISISGTRAGPPTWSDSPSSATITLALDRTSFASLLSIGIRGNMCKIKCGHAGLDYAFYEDIYAGTITAIQGVPPTMVLTVQTLALGMRARFAGTGAATVQPFYSLGETAANTVVDATSYTAGDTDIELTDDIVEFNDNGNGVVIVTGDGGSEFKLKVTGPAVGTGPYLYPVDTSNPQLGNALDDATSGNAVRRGALLEGHPLSIWLKCATSTGTGGNGTYDVYEDAWGWELPVGCIEVGDIESIRDNWMAVGAGTYDVEFVVTEPVADGTAFWRDFLTQYGAWMVDRQGRLTIRAGLYPDEPAFVTATLDLQEVGTLRKWGQVLYWDPRMHTTYLAVTVADGWGTTSSSFIGASFQRPVKGVKNLQLEDVFSNSSAITTEVVDRVGPWWSVRMTIMTVRVTMFTGAPLCAGDHVEVITDEVPLNNGVYPNPAPAIVLQASPKWSGGEPSVELVLGFIPLTRLP